MEWNEMKWEHSKIQYFGLVVYEYVSIVVYEHVSTVVYEYVSVCIRVRKKKEKKIYILTSSKTKFGPWDNWFTVKTMSLNREQK